MSEAVPEARPAPQRSSSGFKGTFTTRIGPLPMWVWLVIITAILIAWRIYSAKSTASTATDQTGTSADQVSSDQVPQFVNQTYVTPTAPVSGPPGPTGPAGPPGMGVGPNVSVPNVVGLKGAQAYAVLRSEALNPGPGGVNPNRTVKATNPPAGKNVPKHTNITVSFK